MGKSSAFQAFLLLRQSIQQRMLPGRGLLLNGSLISLGTAGDVLFRGAERDEIGITVVEDGQSHAWLFKYGAPFEDVLSVANEPVTATYGILQSSNFHYLAAERIGPRSIYDLSYYEVSQQRQIGRDGRYAVAYLDSFSKELTLPHLRHEKAVDDSVASQVTAWFDEISPGTQLSILPYPEIGRVKLGIGFESGRIKTKPFSAPNVGFGLSYALPLLVAILAAKTTSLLLIENPEAHLNPKGQFAMGRLLAQAARAGVQVIAETHSDHVLNGARIAIKRGLVESGFVAVHFFDRRVVGDEFQHYIQSPTIDKDGRLSHWPNGFFDQWENALEELL